MFDIAEQVQRWRASGLPVSLARVISTRGFSSREPLSALAATANQPPVGQLFSGAGQEHIAQLLTEQRAGARLEEVTVSDEAAVRAGLACGGTARLLIQPAVQIPEPAWTALVDRAPVARVERHRSGHAVLGHQNLDPGMRPALAEQVTRYVARGDAGRPAERDHQMRMVLAHAPPEADCLGGRGPG